MEMGERELFKDFDDTQLEDERARLETEYDKLNDDYLCSDMPRLMRVRYEGIMDNVDRITIEQKLEKRGGEAEASFVKARSIKFVNSL